MPNSFMHIELLLTDTSQAKSFYGQVFDWTFEEVPRGDNPYTMIQLGEGIGANFMRSPLVNNSAPVWLAYVQVDDLNKALTAVESLGGAVMKARTDEPGMGSFAIIKDPAGAMLGLWELAKS